MTYVYRTYRKEETRTMNKYALRIRDHWMKFAPSHYAALENPESYFTEQGDLAATQIERLALQLAGSDPMGETYLEKVARLTSTTRLAEEQVLAELEMPVEMNETEARLEWEATRPSDESLIGWARAQDGQTPFEDQLQELTREWMLPARFFEELATASNPWTYLQSHSQEMSQSNEARYQRHRST